MAYRNVTGMLPVHLFSSKVGAIIVTLYLVIPVYVHLTKHPPPLVPPPPKIKHQQTSKSVQTNVLNQQHHTLKRSSQDIWRSLIKSTPSPSSVTMATSWMQLLVPGTQNPSTYNRNFHIKFYWFLCQFGNVINIMSVKF